MIDDRDILRHLDDGGDELWKADEAPPALDLAAIVGADPRLAAPRHRTVRLRPLALAGGAAMCVAAGMFGGALIFGGADPTAPPRAVAETGLDSPLPARRREVALDRIDRVAPAGAVAQASVFTATDGRTVDLRASGLDVPRKGEFYELWVLGDAGRMVSLGLLQVNAAGAVHVRVPLPVSLHRFPVFDISLESGDGDPTHSGRSVLRSAAAA